MPSFIQGTLRLEDFLEKFTKIVETKTQSGKIDFLARLSKLKKKSKNNGIFRLEGQLQSCRKPEEQNSTYFRAKNFEEFAKNASFQNTSTNKKSFFGRNVTQSHLELNGKTFLCKVSWALREKRSSHCFPVDVTKFEGEKWNEKKTLA